MSTVKLTADLSGEFIGIIAESDDGSRKVIPTDIESTYTMAMFRIHGKMHEIARDLGGVIDGDMTLTVGTRYVTGVR